VPIGVERVLLHAAVDPSFKQALLADRQAALLAHEVALRPSERAMLLAIPTEQLAAAIEGMDPSPANVQRRSFMRVVAASAMTIAAAESVGCGSDTDQGPNPPQDAGPDFPAATGSRPDWPDTGPAQDTAAADGTAQDAAATDATGDAVSDAPSDAAEDDLPFGPDMSATGIRPDGWQ
jgi:hypothetical protein